MYYKNINCFNGFIKNTWLKRTINSQTRFTVFESRRVVHKLDIITFHGKSTYLSVCSSQKLQKTWNIVHESYSMFAFMIFLFWFFFVISELDSLSSHSFRCVGKQRARIFYDHILWKSICYIHIGLEGNFCIKYPFKYLINDKQI